MNIDDLFYTKKKEYRFLQEHATELLGSRVTSFQLEALGCEYLRGKKVAVQWSGRSVGRVWKCKDLGHVLSELRTGEYSLLGIKRAELRKLGYGPRTAGT